MNINLSLHPKQSDCFLSEATEILYGGSAGGGKSHAIRVIALYYALSIPNIQIFLFRRLSEDLKKNHLDGSSGFVSLLYPLVEKNLVSINYSTSQVSFFNKAKIHLCHCQHEKDVVKYQGVEMNILLIDELTHFSEYIYTFLRSRVRLGGLIVPSDIKGSLPRIICGSNPTGVGHQFVKQYFIDGKEPLKLYRMDEKDGGALRQFIPAKLEDNPTMTENDPMYRYKLQGLGGALAKAMLDGDWDVIEGAYFDKFTKDKHVIPSFEIPYYWYKLRAFDWGYRSPFAVLWGAVSDGNLVNIQGSNIFFPKGSLIIYREYYGWTGKVNDGIKMSIEDIAINTKKLQREEINRQVADPSIFDVSKGESIAERMAKLGILYEPADNKRVVGWQQIRSRLAGDKPMIYITEDCKNLIRTLPVMQYDRSRPEDLDTGAEDHLADALRYMCMARPITIDKSVDIQSIEQSFWSNFNPKNYSYNKEKKSYE